MRSQELTGPGFWKTLHLIREFKNNTVRVHEKTFKEFGNYVGTTFMGQKLVFIYHPDGIQHILKTNYKNYIKGDGTKEFSHVLGKGLITTDGDEWLKLRKIQGPEFHSKKIDELFPVICEQVNITLRFFKNNSEVFDVVPHLSRLAFSITGESLFGTSPQEVEEYQKTFSAIEGPLSKFTNDRMYDFFNWPTWFPTRGNVKFNRDLKKFNEILKKIISKNNPTSSLGENMLSKLHQGTANGCPILSEKSIRDQVATLLVAGIETTSYALSWTFYLLGKHQDIQNDLRDELNANVSNEIPSFEEVKKLTLTEQIFLEAMRLFPTSPLVDRKSIQDDEVCGFSIEAGSMIEGCQWVTHRHPDFWTEPNNFNPRRFEKAEIAKRHPFAYFPFSGGPRQCIGASMALLEGVIILAAIIKNFRIELDLDREPRPHLAVTLRPVPGVFIKAIPI